MSDGIAREKKRAYDATRVEWQRAFRGANRARLAAGAVARYHANPEPRRIARRAYYHNNIERTRFARVGWTVERYREYLDAQAGCCASCGEPFQHTPHADHDHVTGEPRGLLCRNCNIGSGNFAESVERLRLHIEYLESHV